MTLVYLVIAIVASLLLAIVLVRSRATDRALASERELGAQREREALEQHAELEKLRIYQGIVDAEAHSRSLVAEAQKQAAIVMRRAEASAEELRVQADNVRRDAEREADERLWSAQVAVTRASAEASAVVETAKSQAREIAGDALKVREQAKEYERVVEAMRNVVEGYGDRYLVPSFSVLDELADQYGFAEAGAKLKEARGQIRELIRTGKAATCDYVEANRRETAIAFVLDAFNGKRESTLADVRDDNFGTLEQRLRDAFVLVNNNGRAFRSACITSEYLAACRAELRWAVAVHELKVREREEQKAVKEAIREEEKVQRELERAIKEAEKEEKMLLKAMEKVRQDADRASDEQKEKYEAQLRELTERLAAAENNKRAISLAQQTRTGHVYVISNEGSFGEHVYKIGLTRRLEPLDRIRELGDASVPFEFDVHALIKSNDAPALERALHKRFVREQVNKVNPRKEFFRVTLEEVRAEVTQLGLEAVWTMAAACQGWKETQALERALFTKQLDEKKWADSQLRQHDRVIEDEMAREAVG